MQDVAKQASHRSAWSPLRQKLFRDRLISSVLSNIGGWMQDTAATWLMTSLTSSPLLIALMQTAASLPVLLFALPAGAMADILDRRKLLLFWQTWMLGAAAVLSVLSFAHVIGPWTLLILTLLLNVGAAMNNPAWQAIVPELVSREELADAISLNSAGYNLARAVGPALGGLAMAFFTSTLFGAGAVFSINAGSFVFVIWMLYRWHRTPYHTSDLPAERMLGSIRAGVRYVFHAQPIQGILIRAFLVTSGVSAMWALLAVVAQRHLKHGALGYGLLNACIGTGAVGGAILLPRVRSLLSADSILTLATGVFVLTLLVMALVPQTALVVTVLLFAGFAWTSTTSTLNIAVQTSAPPWVQARLLGTYQMTFQAGMAIGSAVWGAIAERWSTPVALIAASVSLLVGLPFGLRVRLMSGTVENLSSARAAGLTRSDPQVVSEPRPQEGPVLISIDYGIDPGDSEAFLHAIHQLSHVRLRDGAIRWGVFRDANDDSHYTETFVVESWAEYLRQRDRMTVADVELRSEVTSFHKGAGGPKISRMIYAPDRP